MNKIEIKDLYLVFGPEKQKAMGHTTKRFFQWSGKMGERL